jgi:hypothetical protein
VSREYRNPASQSAPPLRKVTANVLTELGWLHGTFNTPLRQTLVDFLAPGVQVIKFTRVQLPHGGGVIPFVALRREAIMLIEPTFGDEMIETPGSVGRTTPRDVTCLLGVGQVKGMLEVLVNVRVSDFLRQQANLIVIHHGMFVPYGEADDSGKARRLGTVIVNLSAAIGVAEQDVAE